MSTSTFSDTAIHATACRPSTTVCLRRCRSSSDRTCRKRHGDRRRVSWTTPGESATNHAIAWSAPHRYQPGLPTTGTSRAGSSTHRSILTFNNWAPRLGMSTDPRATAEPSSNFHYGVSGSTHSTSPRLSIRIRPAGRGPISGPTTRMGTASGIRARRVRLARSPAARVDSSGSRHCHARVHRRPRLLEREIAADMPCEQVWS